MNPRMSHPGPLGDGVFCHRVTINPKGLGDGIGRLPHRRPLGYLLANFNPKLGPTDLIPLAFARAIPAFVLSLIFWASNFARDARRANQFVVCGPSAVRNKNETTRRRSSPVGGG
jgi:hypothetical protein